MNRHNSILSEFVIKNYNKIKRWKKNVKKYYIKEIGNEKFEIKSFNKNLPKDCMILSDAYELATNFPIK